MDRNSALTSATVAVIGAGSIGVAFAIVFARAGFAVRVQDPDATRRATVPRETASRLADLAEFGLVGEDAAASSGGSWSLPNSSRR